MVASYNRLLSGQENWRRRNNTIKWVYTCLSVCPFFCLFCIFASLSVLTIHLSICLSVCLFSYTCQSICILVHFSPIYFCLFASLYVFSVSVCPSIHVCLSVHLSVCPSVCPSIHVFLSVHLSITSYYLLYFIYVPAFLSVCLSVCVSNFTESNRTYSNYPF